MRYFFFYKGFLFQLVDSLIYIQIVAGSNPAEPFNTFIFIMFLVKKRGVAQLVRAFA